MIAPWWRKHACEPCDHLLLRSSRILSQPPCYHRRPDSTNHGQYHHHDLYFHPIIQTLPGYLSYICCTSVTFKRWPSSASICSFDPQKNSHLKIKKMAKTCDFQRCGQRHIKRWFLIAILNQGVSFFNAVSKAAAIRDVSDCFLSQLLLKEAWTPLPVCLYSAGHLYIFKVLSNTCYLCDSWW